MLFVWQIQYGDIQDGGIQNGVHGPGGRRPQKVYEFATIRDGWHRTKLAFYE